MTIPVLHPVPRAAIHICHGDAEGPAASPGVTAAVSVDTDTVVRGGNVTLDVVENVENTALDGISHRRQTMVHSSEVALTWPVGMWTTTLVVDGVKVEVEREVGVSVLSQSEEAEDVSLFRASVDSDVADVVGVAVAVTVWSVVVARVVSVVDTEAGVLDSELSSVDDPRHAGVSSA